MAHMLKNKKVWIPLVAILGLAAILAFVLHRQVTIQVDGAARTINTYATTTGWALYDAGVTLNSHDLVTPALSDVLGFQADIRVERAAQVNLYTGAGPAATLYSTSRLPADWLKAAGLSLASNDRLLWNASPLDPSQPLPDSPQYNLQILRAHTVVVVSGSTKQTVSSDGPTLGDGLWAAGIPVSPLDFLSASYTDLAVDIATSSSIPAIAVRPAAPVQVQVDGATISGKSAAATVGEVLAELGVSLQGLDRATPAEDQPLPADGQVKVTRVREEIVLNQTSLPFKTETVADAQSELDTIRLISAGHPGIQVTRQRVRYEDGKEVARQTEGQWIASQPQNRVTGYGTKIVIHTLDTPDGTISYYRKATVYATSFAPCNFIQFIGHCSYTTANGSTLQKGVIGVGEAWYHLFVNQHVYIDGYGPAIVGDYGYIPGFWIDLGYSDADFQNWHRNTTIYFLAPAPANVPWTLPR
jgi:uncharacterized protein YabE (DUF348 family)